MGGALERRSAAESGGPDTGDERLALVRRVADSPRFVQAKQLREFLLYVAGHALSHETGEINEYKIGCSVLHRRADFNPAEDNIVRVQARRLREKLAEYFAHEGRDEPLLIVIPKGSYIPEFIPRALAETPVPAPGAPAAVPGGGVLPWKGIAVALAVAAAALAVVAAVLWRAVPKDARPGVFGAAPPPHPLLARILVPGVPTTLVASDTNLGLFVGLGGGAVTLHEYLDPGYPDNVADRAAEQRLRGILRRVAVGEYTSLTELNILSELHRLNARYGAELRVRHAHQVNVRDLDEGNFVVVGTPLSNPWFDLFDEKLRIQYDYAGHTFQDKNAGPGQATSYRTQDHGSFRESFVDVALLPNLTGSGSVLLLRGLAPRGPETAAALLFDAGFGAAASQASGGRFDAGRARHFELLVRVRMVSGTPKGAEILTVQDLAPSASAR